MNKMIPLEIYMGLMFIGLIFSVISYTSKELILVQILTGVIWAACFYSTESIILYNSQLPSKTMSIGSIGAQYLFAGLSILFLCKSVLNIIGREKYEIVTE